MPIQPGTRFDRYQILAPLGVGGMGEVYLALDTRLGRKVALKLLPEKYTKDPVRLRRFEQEAQAASALNHPNIITIHEIGEVDGVHFIATEYVEGVTLRKRLTAKRLSIREALDTAIQIANALAAAHTAGIVHRDIKPENVMLRPDGYVKVLDFGLAKLLERNSTPQVPVEARQTEPYIEMPTFAETKQTGAEAEKLAEELAEALTERDTSESGSSRSIPHDLVGQNSDSRNSQIELNATGEKSAGSLSDQRFETVADIPAGQTLPGLVMGTLHYMSPEQARGRLVDTRTDIFSLGVVLYEMLTRRMPFEGPSSKAVINAILTEEPTPVAHFRPDTPDLLEWIVAKALIKEREERYQTAREMLNDLKRLQQRLEIETELARKHRRASSEVEDSGEQRRDSLEQQ
jgi:serine/threonine protein kinase